MMPSRPPCVTIGGQDYIAGDTVRYRLSEADPWRLGHVLALSQRDGSVQVEPARGLDRRPLWFYEEDAARLEPYAPPHPGATEVEDETPPPPPPPPRRWGVLRRRTPLVRKTPLRAARLPVAADPCFVPSWKASALPLLRIVRTAGHLRTIPKPEPPARSPRYLTYVQAEPCCGCDAPAPSEAHHEGPRGVSQKASDFLTAPLCWRCHHAVTATHALPGRSQGETRALIHQIQAALLARWAAAREAEAEREAEQVAQVPILRLVAGGGR